MDFNNTVRFMGQQLKALKEIEDLLAHNEKHFQTHGIKPEDIEALKNYVADMKLAASTAEKLAGHYNSPAAKTESAAITGTAEKKPDKKKSTPKQEPPKEDPPEDPPAEPPAEDEFDFLN